MYQLSDIYIGNFPLTQSFGENPARYSARYGIKSHNGIDIACPTLTPILATADGWIKEIGSRDLGTFDSGGYGNYIKVVHNGFLSIYAHLNDIQVKLNDRVVKGQLIAHSNNTGFSTAPHLHFGVAPCDEAGNKTESNNGWSGYIDPMGNRTQWTITNPTSPVVPGGNAEEETLPVKSSDFKNMVAQGTNYKDIVSFLKKHGLDAYLSANGLSPIDFNANPEDPTGGEKVNKFLAQLIFELKEVEHELEQARLITPSLPQPESIATLPTEKKDTLIKSMLQTFKDWAFVKKEESK